MANGQGGYRPTASQNNPTRVNPMGGDGQSGRNLTQPAKYIPGMRSQGVTSQEVYDTQTQAPMAAIPQPTPAQMELPPMPTGISELQADANVPITEGLGQLPPGISGGFYRTPTLSQVMQKISQYDPTGTAELIYSEFSGYGY